MTDTVKLIIEIPNPPKNDHERWVLAHGTPLDNNSERAEVQAYFDGEAYGWEQGRKALIDDVKAEIEKASFEHYMEFGEYIGEDCRKEKIVYLDNILEIIGKAESEVKPNDKRTDKSL